MNTRKMISIEKNRAQEIKQYLDENKPIKWALYIGVGVLSLFIVGRLFSALASSVRGFNEFRSAIKGN
jgi:hypothetical protein